MRRFISHIGYLFYFFCYFTFSFVRANLRMILEVILPGSRKTPGIVRVPLASRTDVEITFISSLISVTPGTLVIAIKSDPPTLYVHGIFAPDADTFRQQLIELERKMLKAKRYRVKEKEVSK